MLMSLSGALKLVLIFYCTTRAVHAYGVQHSTLPPPPPPYPSSSSSSSSLNQGQGDKSYSVSTNNFVQQLPTYAIGQPQQVIPAATSCYVDLKCFSCSPGFSIAQGFPFERRTPVTCEECLDLCLERQANPYPYCCRAAVYDFAYRSCDLFAVDGKSSPQVVTKYQTRSYFVPTGQCTKASKEEPSATEEPKQEEMQPLCPEGQLAKFVEVVGYGDSSFHGEHTLTGYTAKECQATCLENKDKDGEPVTLEKACSALTIKGKNCELSTTALGKISDLRENALSTYMTALCLPEKLVAECPNNFVYAPRHVLVGFAKAVMTAATERECIELCLTSSETLGFYCKSGMYYHQDASENCILNTESRSTQPNVYTEDQEAVVYFELGCGRTGRRLAQKFRKSFSQALFDLPAAGLWTAWSSCQGAVGTSVRYRSCREKDVRECPKEVRSCSHPSDRPSLPNKPETAGRFPSEDLWKRKKDHPAWQSRQ